MMETREAIEIENVGPTRRLRIEINPDGGLHVLRGRNGTGKSRTLEAAKAYLEGGGALEPHYDATEGAISGIGTAKLRVGRKTTRSGELEVETLGGDDLAALVDPHLKDAEAADAERAKAICRLAKIKPDLAPFEALVGGADALRAIASNKSLGLDSLPETAAAIKRDVEADARKIEGEAKNEAGRATGIRETLAGVDFGMDHDEARLGAALEDAIRTQTEMRTRAQAAALARKTAQDASEKLARAREGYQGLTVEDASANVTKAEAAMTDAGQAVADA